ncbi:hypothetical protein FRB96_002231 [Tulasnella sp. 330]|nr:hypothetical protein FRB96_002231 [Tulasnella sp. 330]KAG8875972.1 hypothetical protein FRB97_004553 [Tulasnella sp. 331]KAG8881422.1 hypothetical protein FRB98_004357 [Tulasnella sp. 332]
MRSTILLYLVLFSPSFLAAPIPALDELAQMLEDDIPNLDATLDHNRGIPAVPNHAFNVNPGPLEAARDHPDVDRVRNPPNEQEHQPKPSKKRKSEAEKLKSDLASKWDFDPDNNDRENGKALKIS